MEEPVTLVTVVQPPSVLRDIAKMEAPAIILQLVNPSATAPTHNTKETNVKFLSVPQITAMEEEYAESSRDNRFVTVSWSTGDQDVTFRCVLLVSANTVEPVTLDQIGDRNVDALKATKEISVRSRSHVLLVIATMAVNVQCKVEYLSATVSILIIK